MQKSSSSSSGPPGLRKNKTENKNNVQILSLLEIIAEERTNEDDDAGSGASTPIPLVLPEEVCGTISGQPVGPGTWWHKGALTGPGKGGIFPLFDGKGSKGVSKGKGKGEGKGKGGKKGGKRPPPPVYDHPSFWEHSPIRPDQRPMCADPIQAYFNIWGKVPPGMTATPAEIAKYKSNVPPPVVISNSVSPSQPYNGGGPTRPVQIDKIRTVQTYNEFNWNSRSPSQPNEFNWNSRSPSQPSASSASAPQPKHFRVRGDNNQTNHAQSQQYDGIRVRQQDPVTATIEQYNKIADAGHRVPRHTQFHCSTCNVYLPSEQELRNHSGTDEHLSALYPTNSFAATEECGDW